MFPLIAVLCSSGLFILAHSIQDAEQEDSPASKTLPVLSDRIANYRIEVRLDPVTRTVKGHEIVTWNNRSAQALDEFCFHLYLNAFKNNRSTFIRENAFRSLWNLDDDPPEGYWGYTKVESIEVLTGEDAPPREVTEISYIQPDDENVLDRTVLRVRVDNPVPPGAVMRFRIDFTSKLPRATRRTGWVEDYFFLAQWFPKIGVFRDGVWNCHQYHRVTEYFADFGVYDVSFTVPTNFVVGATGKRVEQRDHPHGTTTYRYYQQDVHDFAWTASPRFLEKKRLFSDLGLPEVKITLLLLPEHAYLEERYFAAAQHALRYYGHWFGAYPYETLTVVDPAYRSNTGGMEYPTFVTGRAHFWTPDTVLSPEGVTVHEVGHQWWYGMVANNEFEESWLDEGLNSWSEARVQKHAYGPKRFMVRFFGGIPFVFNSVKIPFETAALPAVRRGGKLDIMTRPGWKYRGGSSYRVNSYSKPEILLWTLERWLGEELMLQAMRTYFQRYQFKHPTTRDFIATMNEVTQKDVGWFFEQTFFSSELVDYAIGTATSVPIPSRQGVFEEPDPSGSSSQETGIDEKNYLTEVVVERLEGAKFPVEVLMVFEDGEEIREQWDGQDRWQRFVFEKPLRLKYAIVDPERKLLLDIDPTNNSRYADIPDGFALATKKWTSKWLFWLQDLLETFAFIG
ncbi:M1 family metallopeptidase [Acidobacteria bacterium AH-259-A15]|nr:M1 family metallopeptidase [Acidobacteria bacterium AH-259-A15]